MGVVCQYIGCCDGNRGQRSAVLETESNRDADEPIVEYGTPFHGRKKSGQQLHAYGSSFDESAVTASQTADGMKSLRNTMLTDNMKLKNRLSFSSICEEQSRELDGSNLGMAFTMSEEEKLLKAFSNNLDGGLTARFMKPEDFENGYRELDPLQPIFLGQKKTAKFRRGLSDQRSIPELGPIDFHPIDQNDFNLILNNL